MSDSSLKHPPIAPITPRPSQYGVDPALVKTRVSELPGMCSLQLSELFPDLPPVIFPGGPDAADRV
jgi:hypothetical protein